mmetsp:Transcript_45892/g.111787  ORF Transcript_45892/g.111787 Transcript_45892/m.111787 type:complete len:317 (-) Transcript_45892:2025-2975(-)
MQPPPSGQSSKTRSPQVTHAPLPCPAGRAHTRSLHATHTRSLRVHTLLEVGQRVGQHLDAHPWRSEDRLRVELNGGNGELDVLYAHDAPVGRLGRREQALGHEFPLGIERVVPPAHDRVRAPLKDSPLRLSHDHNRRRLAVHRHRQDVELPPVVFYNALQPQAHPKDRNLSLLKRLHRRGDLEVRRVARARGQDGHVKHLLARQPVNLLLIEPHVERIRADSHNLSPRLADIVGEGVHKRVLVVDQQHTLPLALIHHRLLRTGGGRPPPRPAQGIDESRRLELRLGFLSIGVRVEQERRPRANLSHTINHTDRPQR